MKGYKVALYYCTNVTCTMVTFVGDCRYMYTGTFTFLCWNLLYLKSTIIKLVTGNRMPSLITVLIYWDILVEEKYSCSLKCTAKEHRFFFLSLHLWNQY